MLDITAGCKIKFIVSVSRRHLMNSLRIHDDPDLTITVEQQKAIKGTSENHLLTLGRYNTILLVDDSRSMEIHWNQVSRAFSNLANVAGAYDKDGIDVYFVNSTVSGHNLKSPEEIENVFQSVKADGQYTPLGLKLFEILDAYLDQIKDDSKAALARIKPINIIVITDGIPSDDPASHIAQVARRLDRGNFPIDQIGIQFVQFGNDPKATEFLKELDDGMQVRYNEESLRDIVDTTPYALTRGNLDPEALMKILLGGVNKRIDQMSNPNGGENRQGWS
ncbi:hypothetical protein H0H92_015263 [Tricholoma furcatifolium]|nr:hypothetical protein H0H92_015263 [Tricholoma furcatifolium]